MFYYLDGTVAEILPYLAVIDCGGVGYACKTTNNTLAALKKGHELLHVGADLVKPPAQGQPRRGGNGPIGYHPRLSPFRLHQSKANGGKAGIDA